MAGVGAKTPLLSMLKNPTKKRPHNSSFLLVFEGQIFIILVLKMLDKA